MTSLVFVPLLSAALISCACIGDGTFATEGMQLAAFNNAFEELKTAEDFKEEIAKYEAVAKSGASSQKKANAHLKLSLLHCHPANPSVNYARSLEELEKYREFAPLKGGSATIQNRMNLLQDVVKLIQTAEDQKKEIDVLRGKNEQLEKQIEQLKQIDVQIEEKRKDLK